MKKIFIVAAIFLLGICATAQAQNYQLESVLVFSRHNLRSPTRHGYDLTYVMTPHKWFKWTSAKGELSLRGGELETIMGQYFRQWLVSENLITENYLPAEGEMRFYANSYQRTIATAQFFSSGMLPVANVKVEHHLEIGKMEPLFDGSNFSNAYMKDLAISQLNARTAKVNIAENYRLLEKVLDFKNSAIAKENGLTNLPLKDFGAYLDADGQYKVHGIFTGINAASDALSLQYYEMDNLKEAAFGHRLKLSEWEKIVAIKEIAMETFQGTPAISVSTSHQLLDVMRDELALKNRKFTFICGHDSNIASFLPALGVEEYSLPQTIEHKTPIGVKFVIEKRLGDDGIEYAALKMIYASSEQIRNKTTLTLENPPMIFPLRLKGLQTNADGFYYFEDVLQRFDDAFNAYYGQESAAA